ncbi:Ser-Thr-rich glycosyl-phosphatidyl-inositol-anchored membrane family-domain-containing protein [Echria macrotheca]|uniref:Ser-Thr-rich glycosyl-phosphatidyl-inositol-anchored membrane family-domain-containing protein n=1 Tax=Echria macrotheca TaxID=438768 RepID=A0AAJ0F1P3_9PEZI|nr:Ser-Thr-rich glycosyl-phosphatidyl-inositol-anchored membrane family-domain-containing protein [Echria macrotheca]
MRSTLPSIWLTATTFSLLTAAIQITSPTKNAELPSSESVTITWTTVSSDPSRAKLVLVNMASGSGTGPLSVPLADDVDLSAQKITVTLPEDAKTAEGYQFNFVSVEKGNAGGILAQSEMFEVVPSSGDNKSETTGTKTATATGTGSVTATATGTATGTGTATAATGASTTLRAVTVSGSSAAATGEVSASGTASGTTTTAAGSASASASSEATAGANKAVLQAGGLLALVAGVVAVVA